MPHTRPATEVPTIMRAKTPATAMVLGVGSSERHIKTSPSLVAYGLKLWRLSKPLMSLGQMPKPPRHGPTSSYSVIGLIP